jgi:hypothetical protein
MKRLFFSLCIVSIGCLVACKNDPKTAAPTEQAETLTAEQLQAETKQAVRIDSMGQTLDQLSEQLEKGAADLEKAISELPE